MEDLVYLINLKDVAEDQPIRTKAITKRLFEAHTKIKAQWLDEWTVVDEDPNKVDETVQDAMQETMQECLAIECGIIMRASRGLPQLILQRGRQ